MTLRNALIGTALLAFALPATASAKPDKAQGKSGAHQKASGTHADHAGHARPTAANRWNGMACAPGLAKKEAPCVPPGQWRRGDRLPDSWSRYYSQYDALPDFYRNRYASNPDYRYVYRNDRVYVVDALSRAIVNVIGM